MVDRNPALNRRNVHGQMRQELWWEASSRSGALGRRVETQPDQSLPNNDASALDSVITELVASPGTFIQTGNIHRILLTAEEVALQFAEAHEAAMVPPEAVNEIFESGIAFFAQVEKDIGAGKTNKARHRVIRAFKATPDPGEIVNRVVFRNGNGQNLSS